MDIKEYLNYTTLQVAELAKADFKELVRVRDGLNAIWQSGDRDGRLGDKVKEFSNAIEIVVNNKEGRLGTTGNDNYKELLRFINNLILK